MSLLPPYPTHADHWTPHHRSRSACTPAGPASPHRNNVAPNPQHLQACTAVTSAPPATAATKARSTRRCHRARHRGRTCAPQRGTGATVDQGAGSGCHRGALHRRAARHGQGLPGRVHRRRAGRPHHRRPIRRFGPRRRVPIPVPRQGHRVPAQGVRQDRAGLRAARRRGVVRGEPGGDGPARGRDGRRARPMRGHGRAARGRGGVDRGEGPEPAAAEAEAGGEGREAGDRAGGVGRGAQRHRVRDRDEGRAGAGRVGAGGGDGGGRHGRRAQDRQRAHREGQHRLALLQSGQVDW